MSALWRLADEDGSARWAIGTIHAPERLLDPHLSLAELLSDGEPSLSNLDVLEQYEPVEGQRIVAPLDLQPVWAAGVTFPRSRTARLEESGNASFYDDVYDADRPELFIKALPGSVRGTRETVRIRADSSWDVPEPELALLLDSHGVIVGCTLGNDLSSRSIEAENPLYLPQAKIWDGSCALGPCIVPIGQLGDLSDLTISLHITRGNDMLFEATVQMAEIRRTFSDLASWLFREQSFPDGVALMTGTSMVPPSEFSLERGDEIVISNDKLGRLHNVIGDSTGPLRPTADPVAVAERYWQAEQAGDVDAIVDCFHADAQFATSDATLNGIEAIAERYRNVAAEMASIRVTTGRPVVQGTRAAIAWTAVFEPRSGAPYTLNGLNVFQVKQDKIFRIDCYYDPQPAQRAKVERE